MSDRSPPSWKGDYPAEIKSSLEQIGELARKHKVEAVLDGGDYFHIKAPTKNSHALVESTARTHTAYPCPTYSVVGNHDIKQNNINTLEGQPLGVLFSTGVFKQLHEETWEEAGVQIRIVGMPYSPFRTLEDLKAIKKRDSSERLIVLVHALASEEPPDHLEDFFGEPVFRYQDLVYRDCPDAWCFGHWHRDQGVVDLDGVQFVNQGAVSRGALQRENLERNPKVSLLEVSRIGVNVSQIPLKVAPAAEVFDLARKARQDNERSVIQEYVTRMKETLEIEATPDGEDPTTAVETAIKRLDFAAEVGERAVDYLNKARS